MPRFDLIVVGAGSAGAVVAARASEDPRCRVLLLEAGPDAAPASDDGLHGPDFFRALEAPGRTWEGLAVSRVAGQAMHDYPRARGIGGSSAVNGLLAMHGVAADYDRWAALGAEGWSWRDVAPVFAALPVPRRVTTDAELGPVDRALAAAALALGHPRVSGHDGDDPLGWAPAHLSAFPDGRRAGVSSVYLEPARTRRNLTVETGALVDRVLLDGRRAVGVRLADGRELEAGAVVVSAGAIHSPAILLRSGVEREGIGQNLCDHPSAAVVLVLHDAVRSAPRGWPVGSVLRWSSGRAEADLQVLPFNVVGAGHDDRPFGMLMVALLQVHSRGRVRLASPDPGVHPEVAFDLLSDERDLGRLRVGAHHLLSLAAEPAVAALGDVVLDASGLRPEDLADDEALDRWLLRSVGGYVHAAGTCRIGDPTDALAVVDPRLRVIGYDALRVADASVMPDLPQATTHLPTVMIGERCAAFLRAHP